MEVIVRAEALAAALGIVKPAIPDKSFTPILSNVLLETTESGLQITATDLAIALRASCEAVVRAEGRTTVLADKFSGWVACLAKDAEIKLSADEKSVTLTSGRNRVKLGTINADDFPPAPATEHPIAEVTAAHLARALGLTVPAAAKDDTRPILKGVLLSFDGSLLTLAGADGFRMGRAVAGLAEPMAERVALTVPAKALQALARLLDVSGNVLIFVDDLTMPNRVAFRSGGSQLVAGLLGGQFPDISRFVSNDFATTVTLGRSDLERQLRAVGLADTTFNSPGGEMSIAAARVSVEPPDTLVIRGFNSFVDHEGVVNADVQGPALEIGMNSGILRGILSSLGGDQVQLSMNGPEQPVRITPPGGDGSELAILMPMHLEPRGKGK